jgi:hypothetical protein
MDTDIIEMPVGLCDNDRLYVSAVLPEPPCNDVRDEIEGDIRFDFRRAAWHCPSVIPV